MASYSAPGARTFDTTYEALALWTTTGNPRFKVIDVIFGCEGTPGDTAMTLRVQRTTAAATGGSALTPIPLDPADQAAGTTAMTGAISGHTLASALVLLEMPCNQRATTRWFAAPGSELVVAATNLAGVAFLTPTAPALAGRVWATFTE